MLRDTQLLLCANMLCTAWAALGVLLLPNDLVLCVAVTWLLATYCPCLRPIPGLPLGFIQMPSNSLVLAAPGMVCCSWDGVLCAVMLSQCYSRGCQPHLHLICAKLGHAKEKSSAKDSAGDTHRGGEENKQVREQENLSAGHCCVKPTSAASFPQCNSLSTDSLTNIPILCWSSPSLDAAMSLSFR